jgi:hypothetical protein
MQTMRDQGITDVLTNDVHLGQEGFRDLSRGDPGVKLTKRTQTASNPLLLASSPAFCYTHHQEEEY